ncbi:hypothetical protein PBI_INDLOVU_58 [Mycobacterium phage Indlovu]|nr:hypothetical protein PBI_INDLOVU_58 [Mycobacterium phage Indlovu]
MTQPPDQSGPIPVPTPTDLDNGITFLRSTTSTRVDLDADGTERTSVEHTARFAIEPGAVPDLTHKYGSQQFRPRWLTVTWDDGRLSRIAVTGPRVLKSGKLAGTGDINRNVNTRDFDWSRHDIERGKGYEGTVIPTAILERINAYETAVSTIAGRS